MVTLVNSSFDLYNKYNHNVYPFQHFNFKKKYLRKCSYILAIIPTNLFINKGAKLIQSGIYIMERAYSINNCETCAIIGIHKQFLSDLLDKDSSLYNILKNSNYLKNIPGINNLSPYKLDVIKYLLKFLYFINNNELILFNIEPKDITSLYSNYYPTANICLPGGGFELQDNYCWEQCARREFKEEVGFIIPNKNSNDIRLITKQKFTFSDRQSMYFIWQIKRFEN